MSNSITKICRIWKFAPKDS